MRNSTNDTHHIEFPKTWESNILMLIPSESQKRHFKYLMSLLDQVKQMYIQDEIKISAKFTLPYSATDNDYLKCKIAEEIPDFDRLTFQKRRNLFAKRYFLSHDVIREIFKIAYLKLPRVICNFEMFHSRSMMTLNDLKTAVDEHIRKGTSLISNQFHMDTYKMVTHTHTTQSFSPVQLLQFMRCVTNIFVQQLLSIMIRSINHVIDVVEDDCYHPRLQLQLVCTHSKLSIEPSIENIFAVYHKIIDDIGYVAHNLTPFTESLNIKSEGRYIQVKLSEDFLIMSHNKLQEALENVYFPIKTYLCEVTEKFDVICVTDVQEQISSLISSKPNFSVCYEHVQKYRTYLEKAQLMMPNEYYTCGKLEQSLAKSCLINHCSEITNALIEQLIHFHLEYSHNICTQFEDLQMKALNIPKDAESLIGLTEFISQASRTFIKEVEMKIQTSIDMLSMLSEITILSEDHIELNKTTINWLFSIEPIFIQSNTLSEAMKSELEDDLQTRINSLNVEVDATFPELIILNDMDDVKRVQEYIEYYKNLIKNVNHIDHEVESINTEEKLFRFPETVFPKVTELTDIIVPFYSLMCTIYQWQKDNAIWLNGPFERLDALQIQKKTLHYFDEITETHKKFKAQIKMDAGANKCFKFHGIADDPDPMQQPAPLKLCWQVLKQINEFKVYLPLVICMCNPTLKARHWKEMSTVAKFDITPNAGTTLQKIIEFNLLDDIKKYEVISAGANKEHDLYKQLSEMQSQWNTVSFQMMYDENTHMVIFTRIDDIEIFLEDHFTKIESMRVSHFIKPIIFDLMKFYSALKVIREFINWWDYLQMEKCLLEPIFTSVRVETSLLREKMLYEEVQKLFWCIQQRITANPTFEEIHNFLGLLETLQGINTKIEHVHEGVKKYIDNKRMSFARFYFLSDTEIQKLLFETEDLSKLHIFINKCFQGIKQVRYKKNHKICSIIGDCKEEIYLQNYISISPTYNCEEKWLIELETETTSTIRKNIHQCSEIFNINVLHKLITDFSQMAIITACKLNWTATIQNSFLSRNFEGLKSCQQRLKEFLTNITHMLREQLILRSRNILMALIIVIVNQTDAITLLLDRYVMKETDFEWLMQPRYYKENDNIIVSVLNTTIKYGYEYDYHQLSIVNTALTDKCIHTLMQAYHYHLYGALIGPTATGKTETMKTLARTLAVQLYIVNTNEYCTYQYVTQIFKGMLSCGAWVCLENFSKLKSSILSVIAQHISLISRMQTINSKFINFEGHKLNFSRKGYMCIIMHPLHANYSILPNNLKLYFRPVSMILPDLNKIIEVELFAGGFVKAQILALKLGTTYKLLSEQLSNKAHYNLGIRSIKAVVNTAINLKQKFFDEDEHALILRSLIDVNIPQFSQEDVLVFQDTINDVFPCSNVPPPNYTLFAETFNTLYAKQPFLTHDVFKLKTIQLYELLLIHRSVILVGDSLVGKTEIIHILANILSTLHKQGHDTGNKIMLETVMPGVLTSSQLFGHLDGNSNRWIDGLCCKIFHRFIEDPSNASKWLIFDGLLDGTWMENLYTVLDDSRMLSLMSGERFFMTHSIHLLFETADIAQVSPATLSRCGIIYIEPNSIDWRLYVLSCITSHSIYAKHEKILYSLFEWSIDPCIHFLQKNCTLNIEVGRSHLVTSTWNLLNIFLEDACTEDFHEKGKVDHFAIWSQAALILAITWGLSGNIQIDCESKFNGFCTSLWNGSNKEYPRPETIKHFELILPNEGLIKDNFYIFKGIGNWRYFGDLLKSHKVLAVQNINDVYVSTINTLKYTHILQKHIQRQQPFLVCGDAGNGKTFLMQNILQKLPQNDYSTNSIIFTSSIKTQDMQCLLLSKLEKIKKRLYGAQKHKVSVNFIDDLSLVHNEDTKLEAITELLRQYFNYGYWYETSTLEKINMQNVVFFLAITTNGHKILCQRFLKFFNIYTVNISTTNNIFLIYSNVLSYKLKRNQFGVDVLSSVISMTNATIDVYNFVVKIFRPIPSKWQYIYNINDISKVISGCSLIQKESAETKITFIRLWVHEILRVFSDRIVDDKDKNLLVENIKEAVKKNFKDSFDVAFDHLPKFDNDQITWESLKHLNFGVVMDLGNTSKSKRYEELSTLETLKSKVTAYLHKYNKLTKMKINIVLSHYVIEHVIRVCRILTTPGGNMLIFSTVNTGKRSIAKLAAFMEQQSMYEPTTDAYYNSDIWRENLKMLLKKCGGERKDATFFMTEREIKDNFLNDIISLLTTGEIANLYTIEEKQSIIEMTRLYAQDGDPNAELNLSAVFAYFIQQCKIKLHFIICFNLSQHTFRTYLKSHSSLLKYCTINYLQLWPQNTLTQIAIKYMEDINMAENIKKSVITTCSKFYNGAKVLETEYREVKGQITYITLSTFLHMLQLYQYLMLKKQEEISVTRKRYLAGLEKLELAAKQVEQMKANLTMLKPQLEASAQQTIITMKEVELENITVEKATILVKQEEEIANKKAEIAGSLRTECEADLAVAIPILEDAVVALNTLKPTDITLVKAMKNPPDTVKLVMAAVCVMLGVPPDRTVDPATGKKFIDYWAPSKRVLGDMNFLQNLKEYDKDNIPSTMMQIIKKTYMTDKSFMPHIVAKASSAAEGLCKWVRAMVSYDEVAKVVAPKKEKLATAQKECDEAEAFLNKKRQTLCALNEKLALLNNSLQDTLQQKLQLENEVESCTKKLFKAKNLIASLGGEKSKWMETAHNLLLNYDNLPGDMLLSCSIIAFMAPYTIVFRDNILSVWIELLQTLSIPHSTDYNFVNTLGTEVDINSWYLYGLPKNRFSTENAIIMNHSKKWCIFIDSQNQANKWIKKMEHKNTLIVLKPTDHDCVATIKNNIELGNPVLLENVEETLEFALDPILSKDIYGDGEDWYLDIRGHSIKYSQDFRLYITTRIYNPHYSPFIFNKLTVINFSIPTEALQTKLLDIVIAKERPEIQEKFEDLLVQEATDKKSLKQQEDNILITLSSHAINILEDENAIKTLDSSKNLSEYIMERQKSAKIMTSEINIFRTAYIQFAKYCAEMFDTLNILSELNHMYRYSFTWFVRLFIKSIDSSNISIILKKRLQFLQSSFTQTLYLSVRNSLFEKHKLLYSFLLCCKILQNTEQVTENEIKSFMSSVMEDTCTISNPVSMLLSNKSWNELCSVANSLPVFAGVMNDFCSNVAAWKTYCTTESFVSRFMPEPWKTKLTLFEKLILIKIIRPDKLVLEVMQFIENIIGITFSYPSELKISQSYAESNCMMPLIFILPSYLPPLLLLSTFAHRAGYSSKFISLSMSEEQEAKAEALIYKAQREGGWIFLENCHLTPSWLSQLEKIIENSDTYDIALDFRLWLSSNPAVCFPISILQNSIKIVLDYSICFKQSLLQAYFTEPLNNKEFFEGCSGKDKIFSKLIYGLCFFHTILREKQYYGPQGWNTPYEFNYLDFQMSLMQLQSIINEHDDVPFNMILYLLGECTYGGKVIDRFDEIYIKCILNNYCNADIFGVTDYVTTNNAKFNVPQRCEYRDFIKHIDSMPLDLSSQTIGMTRNIMIFKDTAISQDFLSSLYRINQIILPVDKVTIQGMVLYKIKEIEDILKDNIIMAEVHEKYRSGSSQPLNSVLHYEVNLLVRIVKEIKTSLESLKSSYYGHATASKSLEKLATEIYNDQVPSQWQNVHIDTITESLSSYINNVLKRIEYIKDWTYNGHSHILRFDVVSSCKMLLCALKIKICRALNIPIEDVTLDFKVLSITSPMEVECVNDNIYFICDLHLCGARWDSTKMMLVDNLSNIFWYDMPVIQLQFINKGKVTMNAFQCPVYNVVQRHKQINFNASTRCIMIIPLATEVLHEHWIKCGTALFCERA